MSATHLGEFVWVSLDGRADYRRPVKAYRAVERTEIKTRWGSGYVRPGGIFLVFSDGTGAAISDEGFLNRYMLKESAKAMHCRGGIS